MANIIIKGPKRSWKSKGATPNAHVGPWSQKAQRQYKGVSQENKGEFQVEKRVQELAIQGFNEAAISGMTGNSEGSVKKLMKNRNKKNIHLDGKY